MVTAHCKVSGACKLRWVGDAGHLLLVMMLDNKDTLAYTWLNVDVLLARIASIQAVQNADYCYRRRDVAWSVCMSVSRIVNYKAKFDSASFHFVGKALLFYKNHPPPISFPAYGPGMLSTRMSCAKTGEPIHILLGENTHVRQRNLINLGLLDGVALTPPGEYNRIICDDMCGCGYAG